MNDYQEEKDKILEQLETDFHYYHDGGWDYKGLKPTEKASKALDELVKKMVSECAQNTLEHFTASQRQVIDKGE